MKRALWAIMVCFALCAFCFCPSNSYAAEYNLKQMTPAVEQALLDRKARFDQLEAYKAKGVIGENNRGYVELFSSDEKAAEIVKGENADRRTIYQAIAEQNGIASQLEMIEKVFAQVQQEKARAGYKVQLADGTWMTK